MTLTEEQYNHKLMGLMKLGWDIYKFRTGIQCRTTVPNPYCEDLLDKACESMKVLLIQLKTHNVDSDGNDLNTNDNWWYPNVHEKSMRLNALVEDDNGGDIPA